MRSQCSSSMQNLLCQCFATAEDQQRGVQERLLNFLQVACLMSLNLLHMLKPVLHAFPELQEAHHTISIWLHRALPL